MLFKISFIYAFVWFIAITLILIFKYITTVYYSFFEQHPIIYFIIALLYSVSVMVISCWIFFDLSDSRVIKKANEINKSSIKKLMESISIYKLTKLLILSIAMIFFLIIFRDLFLHLLLDFLLLPSYLLAGSYSIDVFPESSANSDILTFTIKETGLSYNKIYVQIYKLNSSSDLRWLIDYVIISNTKEALSNKTFMLGVNYGGIWYLNVDTSSLQPGNYLLHAEITDDGAKNSTLPIIKHTDKLFYIPSKSTNYSLNSTKPAS